MAVDPGTAKVIGLAGHEQHDTLRRMQIRVLGPLEAIIDDQPVAIGGAKQRAVLAMLGLEANHAVAADRLIEGLWGDEPPASAAKMVQNYVWRLRGVLAAEGGPEIVTRGRAYELRIDRESVDVCRLERLVSEASRAAAAGRSTSAAREALALFRGDPLADVADEPFADPEIRRLEELRLAAAELAVDADLAAGRHHELVGEIEALLAANPLRERLHAQRMLALYRCGRQAEALEAYRHARTTLVEEIGVEPSAELRQLHEAILNQDPSLDVAPAASELPRELDATTAPPLTGRDGELRRLRARWQRAADGSGALVTLVGAYGAGKTRLAAELAGEAHRDGATVVYVAGTGAPEAALAALARTLGSRRPLLVVVDDADRAQTEVRAALRKLAPALGDAPVLVLATGLQAAALARLEPAETVAVEPLDAGGVRAISAFYAPAGEDGAIPVDELLAASGGVARRVHEAASEWARREATRRVDAVAGRTAAGRSEARALEAELAGTVIDLQSARERAGHAAGAGERDVATAVCPYKGLATFEADDAEYFFGRERLVAELVARLVGAPLLAIVGPSGSGKSSALRAGLLPALAGGVLPGSENWTQAVIRPGRHPLRELRVATRRLSREWRALLAVDQFEELFTACEDEAERAEFAASLARAAAAGTVVVLAVRADFYGRCAAYPELSRLLGANHVLVGPMSRDELARAIERPAQRAGLVVEAELVEALLRDVEGEPGALPLLSSALLELWRERDGRHVRLTGYARSGGVHGAVARLAEEVYVGLDPAHQAIARTLLMRLADEDEGGAVVRRRVALADLDAENGEELAGVVEQLADRRLLTVSDGAVEVAHEALLREWPRLRAWLADDAEGRRLHRRLGDAARAWEADGRDPGGLYRGARLEAAIDWSAGRGAELSPLERAFLDDSRSASGRAQRRLRMTLAGVGALLVLAVIAGLVALDQRGDARAEATTAAAQRLGAQALADPGVDRAMLFARQGVALEDSVQTRSNLLATLLKSPAAIGVIGGDGDPLLTLDLTRDGRTLSFIDADGTLSRVDAGTRRPIAPRRTIPGVETLRGFRVADFTADGSRLAISGLQPSVIDPATRTMGTAIPNDSDVKFFTSVQFSADGRSVIATTDSGATRPTMLERVSASRGTRVVAPQRVAGGGTLVTVLVVPGGAHVVTTQDGGPTVVRDARSLRPERSVPVGGDAGAISEDGHTILVGGRDGAVRFIDLATGSIRVARGRHGGAVVSAAFSDDGRTAFTAGEDNRIVVWDTPGMTVRETLPTASRTIGLVVSPDGRTLYSGGVDGKVVIWDLAGDRRLGRTFGFGPDEPTGFEFDAVVPRAVSPDGRLLALGHRNGSVTLTDARTLRTLYEFRGARGPVVGLGVVPDSGLLAVGGEDGYLALVDPRSGSVVERLRGHRTVVIAPSFSADGRRMLTFSPFETILLWTLEAGRPMGSPRRVPARGSVAAALARDGRSFATAGPLGIEIYDTETLKLRGTLPDSRTVSKLLAFTPDGRHLLGGSTDGWTRAWSTTTWKPVTRRLTGHTSEVVAGSMSPDGRTLATGSADGIVRLYDLRTQRPVGAPLPAVANRQVAPEFSPDGAYLYAFTQAGRQYRWDVRPSSWERRACRIAGRTLTRAEWNDTLAGREYRPACAG